MEMSSARLFTVSGFTLFGCCRITHLNISNNQKLVQTTRDLNTLPSGGLKQIKAIKLQAFKENNTIFCN